MFSNISNISSSVTSWLGGTKPDDDEAEQVKETVEGSVETPVTGGNEKTEEEKEQKSTTETDNQETESSTLGGLTQAQAELQQQLDEAGAKAINTAKEWGSWIYGMSKTATTEIVKTAKTVKNTVEEKTILGDFNKEQNKFMTENKEKKRQTEAGVAPWIGYNEEEAMKKQIMALSQDQRNFLRHPPAGVQFQFDYESSAPVAASMLLEDPNLKQMRFDLVPKLVSEEHFWRNYFYRVSLIKQSAQLTSLAQSSGNLTDNSDTKSTDSGREGGNEEKDAPRAEEPEELPPSSPVENEFISDAFQSEGQDIDEEALKKEMQQLGVQDNQQEAKKDDMPEWERELAAELQEYEVVDDGDQLDDDDLEKELLQQLESEQA